jgi:hypothetical protein
MILTRYVALSSIMSKNSFMAVQMSLGLPLSQSAFLIAAAVWTMRDQVTPLQ